MSTSNLLCRILNVWTYPVTRRLEVTASLGKRWLHAYTESSVQALVWGVAVQGHQSGHCWQNQHANNWGNFTGLWSNVSNNGQFICNSTEQSPSWEPDSHEIPRLVLNPRIHYRVHKSPPLVPIQSQMNPVHNTTFHFVRSILILSF